MSFLNDKHSKEKMFAIIRQGNKQYRVSEGDTLRIDLMNAENGSSFETDQVLAVGGEGEMKNRPTTGRWCKSPGYRDGTC